MSRSIVIGMFVLGLAASAAAVSIPGGGSKRNDCAVALQADGLAFPAGGSRVKGTTCADGGPCDADGLVDGACQFLVAFCLNVEGDGCTASEVSAITVKSAKLKGGGTVDTSDLQAAADALELPSSGSACSGAVPLIVPVRGPDNKGELASGTAKVKAMAATSRGKDKDQYSLVCRPSTGAATTSSTVLPTTTTTSLPGTTTTTSTTLPPGGIPGAGLQAEILGAAVDAAGVVTVDFSLTDDAGVPVTPQSAATSDPNRARARFTIARIEVNEETVEGFTTTFTRYQNYILNAQGAPSYDSGGTFAPAGDGTWTYTFGRMLPGGFPADLTHVIGAQIQRTFEGESLVQNPIFDFVPSGGAITTRQVTSTAQCNACHDPLQAHGTGRREVRLCQLCHTDQFADPDTGASIDLKNMVHRIHRGKDLPSVADGPVGAHYGFGDDFFAENVTACAGGALAGLPCQSDADCPGGTCTGATAVGVGFPKDLRNCDTCHTTGSGAPPDADNFRTHANTFACTGCHDDVNPSEAPTDAGAPGTGHIADDQPEALCRLCHTADGDEFDESVPGAHVVPARSQELTGLVASIQGVQGTPGGTVTIDFQVVDAGGMPVDITGFNRVAFATSGPTSDLGGGSVPLVQGTMVGGGSTGTLMGPDAGGNYSYTSSVTLPPDAAGSWRLGLEMRRPVTLSSGASVNEAAPNPVIAFSVDGSPVEERRTIVDMENCASCHGTFSVDFSIHGNLRNRVEYCVICHNPNVTDFARRVNAAGVGADLANETISFEHMIHKIHRGEALENHPYVIYGFGSAPANFTPHDFAEVLFPGDLRNCDTCHVGGSEQLPLPGGLLPTRQSVVDTSVMPAVELVTGSVPAIQDACLACHDGGDAGAHAETNTTGSGAEACNVCHAEGSLAAVSEVHAR